MNKQLMNGLSNFDLTNKKAIVTGGYTGLGKGIAEALRGAGAKVVIIDVNEKVSITAQEIGVYGLQGDLSNRQELVRVFHQAVNLLGGLDILVNNAGILKRNKVEMISEGDWDQVIEINLNSVFLLCQLAGEIMLKKGSGKIINMASMLSFFGGYMVSSYAASKGAVLQLTKALSNEWAPKGICVNALAPGYMDTSINTSLVNDQTRSKEILSGIPNGRWGTPDDLKGAAIFLASSASDYISGVVIPVDGGFLSR